MSIKKTAAQLLAKEGRVLTPLEVSKVQNLAPGQASIELKRLCQKGLAKQIGRGEYIFTDREALVNYLEASRKVTKQHKDSMGDTPNNSLDLITRPHNFMFSANVVNAPEPEVSHFGKSDVLGCWRGWRSTNNVFHFSKLLELPGGLGASVRYSYGPKKRTITVYINDVLVPGPGLENHLEAVRNAAQEALTAISREDGFRLGLLKVICRNHFALRLPVEYGVKLPGGKIPLNEFWWIDNSFGPELESDHVGEFKKLLKVYDNVEDLKGQVIERLDYIGERVSEIGGERLPSMPEDGVFWRYA